MVEDHDARDGEVELRARLEVLLRLQAERRLIEQEFMMRWGLFAVTVLCSVVGLGLLLRGETYGGATALAAATGSGVLSRRQ